MSEQANQKISSLIFVALCLIGCWVAWQTVQVHLEIKLGLEGVGGLCNISEQMNCSAVAKSDWAEIAGYPLGAYGFVFYLTLVGLLVHSWLTGFFSPTRLFRLYSPVLIISVVFSIFLFLISKFVVKALCPLCLILYLINFLMLATCLWAIRRRDQRWLASLIAEYRDLGRQFWGSLKSLEVRSLVEYLLALGIVSVIILGTSIFLKYQEYQLRSQVVEWPTTGKVDLGLQFKNTFEIDYHYGNLQSGIEIVEFADFECPFCRQLGSQIKPWLSDFEGKYYLVYLNYPLDQACNKDLTRPFHQYACFLANLARCAGEQNKFWEVYYYLMQIEQEMLSSAGGTDAIASTQNDLISQVAAFAALDQASLAECIGSGRQLVNIQRDIERANKLAVTGTPALFINGQRVDNKSLSKQKIHNIMEKILGKSPQGSAAK